MLKTSLWKNLNAEQQKELLARPSYVEDLSMQADVMDILRQVRGRGDKAIREYTEKFDKSKVQNLNIKLDEMVAAETSMDPELKLAMQVAIDNVLKFHEAQRPRAMKVETKPGLMCELQWHPIDTVGFYIPSGSAPLFSTVIMQAIPAWVAGCRRRVLCTPPQKDGKVHPAILTAAQLCGLTEIYAVGGAQAIAAMAYGTETIPKVDKIFGPGNAYVTIAKQLVAQDPAGAAIDMPAGPSEVMIVSEPSPRPDWIAADMLAQAEHDANAQAILVTTDTDLPDRVLEQIHKQLEKLPRKAIAEKSLQNNGRIIVVQGMKTALEIANRYAPEHLILHNIDAAKWVPEIRHAGSVFVGPWSPEAAGDYASGTNHVLPTYGYARAYSGLTVLSFMKSMTVQHMTRDAIKLMAPTLITLAEGENLHAHANSVRLRLEEK